MVRDLLGWWLVVVGRGWCRSLCGPKGTEAITCRVMQPGVRICSDTCMHELRTPDGCFVDLPDFPFSPHDVFIAANPSQVA